MRNMLGCARASFNNPPRSIIRRDPRVGRMAEELCGLRAASPVKPVSRFVVQPRRPAERRAARIVVPGRPTARRAARPRRRSPHQAPHCRRSRQKSPRPPAPAAVPVNARCWVGVMSAQPMAGSETATSNRNFLMQFPLSGSFSGMVGMDSVRAKTRTSRRSAPVSGARVQPAPRRRIRSSPASASAGDWAGRTTLIPERQQD